MTSRRRHLQAHSIAGCPRSSAAPETGQHCSNGLLSLHTERCAAAPRAGLLTLKPAARGWSRPCSRSSTAWRSAPLAPCRAAAPGACSGCASSSVSAPESSAVKACTGASLQASLRCRGPFGEAGCSLRFRSATAGCARGSLQSALECPPAAETPLSLAHLSERLQPPDPWEIGGTHCQQTRLLDLLVLVGIPITQIMAQSALGLPTFWVCSCMTWRA